MSVFLSKVAVLDIVGAESAVADCKIYKFKTNSVGMNTNNIHKYATISYN